MKKLIVSAITILGFSAISFGQSAATATATAILVKPLTIAVTSDMNFGTLAATADLDGTVVLGLTNDLTPDGGARVIAGGAAKTAVFTISGEAGESISLDLPSAEITLSNGTQTLKVNTWTPNKGATAVLDESGSLVLKVGATIEIPKGTVAGTYKNDEAYKVTVDYN